MASNRPFNYGFSCEFLDAREILNQGVPKMMKDHEFGLFLKLYDEDLNDDYKELLGVLKDEGIYEQFFPWPLLKVEDGYYPNERTVDKFQVQVKRLLDWTKDKGFDAPPYILVDLEPSTDPKEAEKAKKFRTEQLSSLRKGGAKEEMEKVAKEAKEAAKEKKEGPDIMSFVGKLIDMIDENVNEDRFMEASRKFNSLVDMMHDEGTLSLAVALPQVFDDLKDGRHLIQDFMTVPVQTVNWDFINYMVFSTDFVQKTKGIVTHDEFCHLAYSYCTDFKKYYSGSGITPSICFGITNFGIQDISSVQLEPELYKKEFNAAVAAGVDQLGIYALEGILAHVDNPNEWFSTVESATGEFTPDPAKMETAAMVRRLFEALDYIAPVLKFLVDSGKVMQIIQAIAGGQGLF